MIACARVDERVSSASGGLERRAAHTRVAACSAEPRRGRTPRTRPHWALSQGQSDGRLTSCFTEARRPMPRVHLLLSFEQRRRQDRGAWCSADTCQTHLSLGFERGTERVRRVERGVQQTRVERISRWASRKGQSKVRLVERGCRRGVSSAGEACRAPMLD